MNPKILAGFKQLAKRNARRRNDLRFTNTIGLLVAKGLLATNRPILDRPNARIDVSDALWAGKNVEPRILEVLPAAIARLPKHFRIPLKPTAEETQLLATAGALSKHVLDGEPFLGIEYKKLKVWMDLPLRDGRIRSGNARKRMKSFRLRSDAIEKLAKSAEASGLSEAEVIERLLLGKSEPL